MTEEFATIWREFRMKKSIGIILNYRNREIQFHTAEILISLLSFGTRTTAGRQNSCRQPHFNHSSADNQSDR